ncbi:hypothetical protein [Streptomyces griseoluteus]|uniref:hypothetical protein n=1 Tax=Streptomyces griseoluteus TaxID=29306 RepID=UPI0036C05460
MDVDARAEVEVRMPDGSLRTSDWVSLTAQDLKKDPGQPRPQPRRPEPAPPGVGVLHPDP